MASMRGNRHIYQQREVAELRAGRLTPAPDDWAHTLRFAAFRAAMYYVEPDDHLAVYIDQHRLTVQDWREQAHIPTYIGTDQPDTCPHCGRRLIRVADFPETEASGEYARLNVCNPCSAVYLFECDPEAGDNE